MKKIVAVLYMMLMVIMLFSSCETVNDNVSDIPQSQPEQKASASPSQPAVAPSTAVTVSKGERVVPEVDIDYNYSLEALIGDKILYTADINQTEMTSDRVYKFYDLTEKKATEIATIKSWHTDSGSKAIMNGKYAYFALGHYVQKAEGEEDALTTLYKMDVENNTLTELKTEKLFPPFTHFRAIDDTRFLNYGSNSVDKDENGDGIYENFFRIYESPSDKLLLERKVLASKDGIYQHTADIYKDEIIVYTVQTDTTEHGTKYYLYIYDLDFNFKRKIPLNMLDELLVTEEGEEAGVWEIIMKDDYCFMRAMNADNFVLKYNGDSVTYIKDSPYGKMQSASIPADTQKFPYLLLEDGEIYDINSGETKPIQFNLSDKYTYYRGAHLGDAEGNIVIKMATADEEDVDNPTYTDVAYYYIKAEDIAAAVYAAGQTGQDI